LVFFGDFVLWVWFHIRSLLCCCCWCYSHV
jgi:hypothetical protein